MHSVRAPRSLCCPAPPCARATLMCSVAHALRLPRACAVRVPPVRSLYLPALLVRSPCMACVRLILCMPPDARASFVPVRPRAALCVHRPYAPVPSRVSCTAASALLRVSFVLVRPCAALRASSVRPCALARFLRTPPLRHPALPRSLHMFHARVPRVHAPSFPAAAFWLKTTVLHKENAPYICKAGKTSLLKMQNRRFQPPPMQKRKNQPKRRARPPNRRAGAST